MFEKSVLRTRPSHRISFPSNQNPAERSSSPSPSAIPAPKMKIMTALGAVRVFNTDGHLLVRLQHGMFLNAPWGIAMAPGDFGTFNRRILIGNFGDGTIRSTFNELAVKSRGHTPRSDRGCARDRWPLDYVVRRRCYTKRMSRRICISPPARMTREMDYCKRFNATATEQRGNSERKLGSVTYCDSWLAHLPELARLFFR